MNKPKRIQRKRTKGWRMPPNTVNVTRPSKYGNPFVVGRDGTAAECKEKYRKLIETNIWSTPNRLDIQKDLRGKNLTCWCPLYDKNGLRVPCHADILLSLANDIPLEKICAPLTIQNSQKSDVLNAEK